MVTVTNGDKLTDVSDDVFIFSTKVRLRHS